MFVSDQHELCAHFARSLYLLFLFFPAFWWCFILNHSIKLTRNLWVGFGSSLLTCHTLWCPNHGSLILSMSVFFPFVLRASMDGFGGGSQFPSRSNPPLWLHQVVHKSEDGCCDTRNAAWTLQYYAHIQHVVVVLLDLLAACKILTLVCWCWITSTSSFVLIFIDSAT